MIPFKRSTKLFILGLVIIIILFWVPTPYVIFQPGAAQSVHSMVVVEGGSTEQSGTFMLTTVRMTYTNYAFYLLSLFNPHADTMHRKEVFRDGETNRDYSERQSLNMIGSQSNAIMAAYNKLGVDYEINAQEFRVIGVIEGMPAFEKLQVGDQIVQVNGLDMQRGEDMVEYLSGKNVGDTVTITYVRDGIEQSANIILASAEDDANRPVIGVYFANVLQVEPINMDDEVLITAGDIGGPSAGLIFTLEIYNRLVEEDISKGYQIAGTGEITSDGTVGPIGGVEYKVVAADREGADLFFIPSLNADAAKAKAESIGTDMMVVPVDTLDAALDYLSKLPSK